MIKILHLPLKREWYEMIERGEKTEEYREVKPYWLKRVLPIGTFDELRICFSYGYTKRTMIFNVTDYRVDFGKPEWGAPKDRAVFVFNLGKRIS